MMDDVKIRIVGDIFQNCMDKKDAEGNLENKWSDSRAEISVLGPFRDKSVPPDIIEYKIDPGS